MIMRRPMNSYAVPLSHSIALNLQGPYSLAMSGDLNRNPTRAQKRGKLYRNTWKKEIAKTTS